MNEKGRQTKLLAAVAILAMVLAACAVFLPAESDAADSTVKGITALDSDVSINDGTIYLVQANEEALTIDGSITNGITLILADGASVSLNSKNVTIYYAKTITNGTAAGTFDVTYDATYGVKGTSSTATVSVEKGIISASAAGVSAVTNSSTITYKVSDTDIRFYTAAELQSAGPIGLSSATQTLEIPANVKVTVDINGVNPDNSNSIMNTVSLDGATFNAGTTFTGGDTGALSVSGTSITISAGDMKVTKGSLTLTNGITVGEGIISGFTSAISTTSSTALYADAQTDSTYVYGNVADDKIVTANAVNFVKATFNSMSISYTDNLNTVIIGAAGYTGIITPDDDSSATGATITLTAGELTLSSGFFKTDAALDIPANGELSVGVNATLTLGASTTIDSGSEFNVYGVLKGGSQSANITITDKGTLTTSGTYGEFNSYSTATISQYIMVNVTNAFIASMNEFKVSDDLDSDVTFSQTQRVVITDNMTVKNANVTILGELVINENVTMTIQPGASVIVGDANSSVSVVTIDGKLTIMNANSQFGNGTFTVAGGKSVDISGTVDVRGDISVTSGSLTVKNGGTIDVDDTGSIAVSAGKFTVETGANLNIEGAIAGASTTTIANAGTITIDNEKSKSTVTNANAGDVEIQLIANGAVLDIDSIVLDQGKKLTVSDEGLVLYRTSGVNTTVSDTDANKIVIGGNYVAASSSNVSKNDKGVFSGVTFTSNMSSTSSATGARSYTHTIDIAGTASFVDNSESNGTIDMTITGNTTNGSNPTVTRGVTVTGTFNCGEFVNVINSGKLTVSGEMYVTGDDSSFANSGTINVTGQIKTVEEIAATINAAMYEVTESGDDFIYYTTLAKAIEADDEIVVLGEITLTEDVEVPAETTVEIEDTLNIGTSTNRDVTLTVADGGIIENNGTIDVYGTLVVTDSEEGLDGNGEVLSDVYALDGTTARYTNIYTALNGLTSGTVTVTRTVDDLVLNQDLIIPSGVTLLAPAGVSQLYLSDGVTLTISEGATLEVWDSIEAQTAFAEEASAVNHTSTIVVDGVLKSTEENVFDKTVAQSYKAAGAYFSVRDTNGLFYYIMPVETAAPMSADYENGEVYIYGESTVGDVAFVGTEELPVVIYVRGDVEFGTIDLTWATIDTTNMNAVFYGTVSSDSGAVSFTDAKGFTVRSVVSDDATYMYVAGTIAEADTSDRTEFDMSIVSGDVYAQGTSTTPLIVPSMTIESGATFTVSGTSSTATVFKVEGISVEGTLDVVSNGRIEADVMQVLGTANLGAATTTQAAGTSDIGAIFAGCTVVDTINEGVVGTLGATGTVNGDFTADIVFASSESTVDTKVTEGMDYTEYYVNDALYMTVYSGMEVPVDIVAYPEIPGEKVTAWQVEVNGELRDVTDNDMVGDFERTDAEIDTTVYHITIVAEYGITDVFVDGDLVDTEGLSSGNLAVDLATGEHTISYRLNNYFGGDVQITLNGETLTDGKFTITSDMPFQNDDGTATEYKIVISGVEAVAPETPSAPSSGSSDDGMGLTDYLLIVLIILIVIMAIMVAVRLMRS